MKTPYLKFMSRCVIYVVCGILTLVLCVFQGTIAWLLFSVIFGILAFANYRLAKKHKDDTSVVDVIANKYLESQKEKKDSKKDRKKKYKEHLRSIEDDFEFDYDDEYDDDEEYYDEM